MAEFKYTPDDTGKVHEKGAIRLLCAPFQSHENGLPEWAKNSADEYARRDTAHEKRVIVFIFDKGSGDRRPSISCVDFAGMQSSTIENQFRVWADPNAAQQGRDSKGVQGGHGNGGKCYMTQMFEGYAMLHTVAKGLGNHYGVKAGSTRFGYVPDPATGRDFKVDDLYEELTNALKLVGCTLDSFPKAAHDMLSAATGFTIVTGVAPKGYKNGISVERLVESLQDHPQMLRTLQMCQVFVIANGALINDGSPLELPEIEPLEGAEDPHEIVIPEHLRDPESRKRVSTINDGRLPSGTLILKTSKTSMRWKKKTRHLVIFEAQSGYIGYVPVPDLDVRSAYRDRIYGVCRLEALEPFKRNDRTRLAESQLTRALERFIAYQVQKYAEQFEIRDRRKYSQKEKDTISRLNEVLDKWKNQFLREVMGGMLGDGEPPPPPGLPSGIPTRLELSLTYTRTGRGVSMRPTLRFSDSQGRRIRPVPFRWVSDDPNVAIVDEDLGIVTSFSYGTTNIYAETLGGSLRSNYVPLEVVHIHRIKIKPENLEVGIGGRCRFEAVCSLADGGETTDVHLIWAVDNPSIARVSSSGMVFGSGLGETGVVAMDDSIMANKSGIVKVTEGKGGGSGKGKGRGFPKVLVSGVNPDPDTGEPVTFSSEDPPVWQRVQDVERNIWWINSEAPLAKLYLNRERGYGYESREWRMYHVERYIDAIVQITLTQAPSDPGSKSSKEWVLDWGSEVAKIQAAAAAQLAGVITEGGLELEEE